MHEQHRGVRPPRDLAPERRCPFQFGIAILVASNVSANGSTMRISIALASMVATIARHRRSHDGFRSGVGLAMTMFSGTRRSKETRGARGRFHGLRRVALRRISSLSSLAVDEKDALLLSRSPAGPHDARGCGHSDLQSQEALADARWRDQHRDMTPQEQAGNIACARRYRFAVDWERRGTAERARRSWRCGCVPIGERVNS